MKVLEPINIHLHLPAGAMKKDGSSAGVAFVRSPFLPFSPDSLLGVHCLSIVRILIPV